MNDVVSVGTAFYKAPGQAKLEARRVGWGWWWVIALVDQAALPPPIKKKEKNRP